NAPPPRRPLGLTACNDLAHTFSCNLTAPPPRRQLVDRFTLVAAVALVACTEVAMGEKSNAPSDGRVGDAETATDAGTPPAAAASAGVDPGRSEATDASAGPPTGPAPGS